MELRQLRYFITVAETLNIRKAAREMYITQPALSRQIRHLEEDLGVELFLRRQGRVHLTEAGHLLLRDAKGLLKHAAEVRNSVCRTDEEHIGHVTVAVAMTLADSCP